MQSTVCVVLSVDAEVIVTMLEKVTIKKTFTHIDVIIYNIPPLYVAVVGPIIS